MTNFDVSCADPREDFLALLSLELGIVDRCIATDGLVAAEEVRLLRELNEVTHRVSTVRCNPEHPISALARDFQGTAERVTPLSQYLTDAWARALRHLAA